MGSGLLAGVGRATITPPLGVPHAGWGAAVHTFADGVHLDLYATVLVLAAGDVRAAICDLDLCITTNENSDEIRRAVAEAIGTEPGAVRLSFTHTHSGPDVWAGYFKAGGEAAAAYRQNLVHLVAGAAMEAVHRLERVSVAVGTGILHLAVNRRQQLPEGRVVVGCNWKGFTDPEVPVIRLNAPSGKPVACIFGYQMHPTILGPANRLHSPDYPGVARRVVEHLTGATGLFLQGSAGNQGPGPEGFSDNLEAAERAGKILGSEVSRVALGLRAPAAEPRFVKVWESGAPLGYWQMEPSGHDDGTLRWVRQMVKLPVRPAPPRAEAEEEARYWRETLAQLNRTGASSAAIEDATWQAKRSDMRARRARETEIIAQQGIELQALRIGRAVLLGAPLEPFAEIGVAIRDGAPFPVVQFSGYTNGWWGYLPTSAAYSEAGYEVDTTPFAQGADQVMIEEARRLIRELV